MNHRLATTIFSSFRNHPISYKSSTLLVKDVPFERYQIRWSTSFFMRHTAEQIWKGVTSVSNAGRKKGRGKGAGAAKAKDLNKGQQIGIGTINVVWPGLNARVIKGRETTKIEEIPTDKTYQKTLQEVRDRMDTFVRKHIHPLERGWSGGFNNGRWFSGADHYTDEVLQRFHGTVLHSQFAMVCEKGIGKQPRLRSVVIIGNCNGCIGMGVGFGENQRTSMKDALRDASLNLLYVPICDGHTIHHDFTSRYNANIVFAHKMPIGYGLVCHRAIRAICIAAGIKDIYVSNEGAEKNFLNLSRAFISGLYQQRRFQDMADEKRLHLVEFREENGWFPNVVASPKDGSVRTKNEIPKDEATSFHVYINRGLVVDETPKKYPDHIRTLGFGKHIMKHHFLRSRLRVRCELRAKYGQVESFLLRQEKEERMKRKTELLAATSTEINQPEV